jgi:hypothetical protein
VANAKIFLLATVCKIRVPESLATIEKHRINVGTATILLCYRVLLQLFRDKDVKLLLIGAFEEDDYE